MNLFLQEKYSDKELKEIIVNKKIDLNNEKHKIGKYTKICLSH